MRREATKRSETTHIVTKKISCTLLTPHPSLLPKYKSSCTNTMHMSTLNTQRMTVAPQTLHPIPIKVMSPSLVRLCKVCPCLKHSMNHGSNCFHLTGYSSTVESKFFPIALSPQRVPPSSSCLKGSLSPLFFCLLFFPSFFFFFFFLHQ